MEDLDRKCPTCNGTGRAMSGDESIDTLEHDVAQLKWKIADLTEDFGLDLRHRTTIPGESDAREEVGKLQAQLAEKLKNLEATRLAAGSSEAICPECHGKAMVLTADGERLANFIYRWIHPKR